MTDESRPVRNRNPLDLRTLPPPEKWAGQSGEDDAPGGPFAVFLTVPEGWRAACVNLLTYQDKHGLRTVRGLIDRWAPDKENDTSAYQLSVSEQTGFGLDQEIDLHDGPTMLKLVTAMAHVEDSSAVWNQDQKLAGLRLAGLIV